MTTPTTSDRSDRAELVGCWLLAVALLATSFGVVWDVQWHDDVGPDTFFTAPHMLIYAAPTLAGLTAVVVVLMRTGVWRADPDSVAATGRSVTVLRVFRAPVGFLVAGIGAAVELVYGMIDLWWHTVYGFDVTLNSPPHVGLSLGGLTICVGAVLAFAALGNRAVSRWGVVLSVATSLTSMMFALFWAQPFEVSVTAVALFALLMVAGVTRAPGWIALTGLLFGALHAIDWFFAPWITRVYAESLGMSLRDNISGEPTLASLYPVVLPLIAVLVEVALVVLRRRGTTPRTGVPAVSAVAALAMVLLYTPQLGNGFSPLAILLATVLGTVAGPLGWAASNALRRLGPGAGDPSPAAPAPVPEPGLRPVMEA
ncbi:hypothetical protein ABZ318_07240 [Streptomyces sp. NPDC006197]|uniref:hypothetical protein n=1 Tax=Streptomyces sp. NPDC006197 TaxID=3156685 RepID=UPI0033B098B0